MRLVTCSYRGARHIGVIVDRDPQRSILLLSRETNLPVDMVDFLAAGEPAIAAARDLASRAGEDDLLPIADVSLLAPVPRPGKIICVGHNYYGHTGAVPPKFPDLFAKFNNVVIGPGQGIAYPRIPIHLDYEGELAVVIGRRARYISEERALDCVAGYTAFNDVTARDYQNRTSQWTLGKSFDSFGPMGPELVLIDEIPDPSHLDLTLTLNGRVMQCSNTCNLIFSIPFLISYISQAITLEPGDVISTGTPSGTGGSLQPPVFMEPGDEVTVRIERIGELTNPIVPEAV